MVLSLYELAWRPAAALIRRTDAQVAHDRTIDLMRRADRHERLDTLARLARRLAFPEQPTQVGGVLLPHPIIVAAGLVKGDGFADEPAAMASLEGQHDIVPGWRSLPALLGAVELGSFTRHPRLGNPGRVVWRDDASGSMQNRVGLRNPGARAAAALLHANAEHLPPVFGINLAVSPGTTDLAQGAREIEEAAGYFVAAFEGLPRRPAWFTLNLSCPNTEDDPRGHQTGVQTERYTAALVRAVAGRAPVWVKVGPDLSSEQLAALVASLADAGARAVVATNTLALPSPGGGAAAGVSGARLRPLALDTVRSLRAHIEGQGRDLDIVASGGVLRGSDLLAFQAAGARAAMVYSALVFRGPLAGALILREARRGGSDRRGGWHG